MKQPTCGLLLFPGMTQLDLTGPYEVFSLVPGLKVLLVATDSKPVKTEHGLVLSPDCSFDDCPQLDVLVIPGGVAVNDLLTDDRHLDFVRRQASTASWVTSVCTGALLLGAAGLLVGYRATTHWRSVSFLAEFGAIPVTDERVVVDRNRITAAGVSAGIDFALLVAAKLGGDDVAKRIQLGIEYDPAPLFHSGHPRTAPQDVVAAVEERLRPAIERRKLAVARAAANLKAMAS
jgi:cyclohexyl-isocyanide hydratase